MIDNVVLIVTGTLHERDVQELIEKCHPLGMFDRYPTLTFSDLLYRFLVYVFFLIIFLFQHCHTGSCSEHEGAL